ncbi:precorrin-8X methylmutase [Microlunatus endophyticus]|uniref:Precorrin-8X methylmutase n=1 Tax=Microlunatus endophyticus TaxID=1716077 RepID=A0A917S5J6_9ACTN|nr:precorrin-8X methylmutase [Microlunatus endophyticus]
MNRPPKLYDYVDDGAEIYRRSFGTIREEADLSGFGPDAATIAVRMIHAAGDVRITDDLRIHPDLVAAARGALRSGAPILVDATMIASGVTRSRLPADNQVICRLHDQAVPTIARDWRTTRSAAAVSLWLDDLDGAVVAIGNAPTALFQLLELIDAGAPRPAAIVGVPVGFVGSAESKKALEANPYDIPYLVVHGRRGGSAMAASALNALAREAEL